MDFAVWSTNRAGMEELRRATVDAFGAYLRDHPDHPDVTVHMGGSGLDDDAETIIGLLLVLEAPSLDAARNFVADSPFGQANLADFQIRPFTWRWRDGRPA